MTWYEKVGIALLCLILVAILVSIWRESDDKGWLVGTLMVYVLAVGTLVGASTLIVVGAVWAILLTGSIINGSSLEVDPQGSIALLLLLIAPWFVRPVRRFLDWADRRTEAFSRENWG